MMTGIVIWILFPVCSHNMDRKPAERLRKARMVLGFSKMTACCQVAGNCWFVKSDDFVLRHPDPSSYLLGWWERVIRMIILKKSIILDSCWSMDTFICRRMKVVFLSTLHRRGIHFLTCCTMLLLKTSKATWQPCVHLKPG